LPYPEAIFDIDYFRFDPYPFNAWAKQFFPGVRYHPSIGHYFIKLLDLKGRLLRLYTQVTKSRGFFPYLPIRLGRSLPLR
jgi:NAD-dependent SIR2 family protein deacetylase